MRKYKDQHNVSGVISEVMEFLTFTDASPKRKDRTGSKSECSGRGETWNNCGLMSARAGPGHERAKVGLTHERTRR